MTGAGRHDPSIGVDLEADHIVQISLLPSEGVLPTTYLNVSRFDLRPGQDGRVDITNSSDSRLKTRRAVIELFKHKENGCVQAVFTP